MAPLFSVGGKPTGRAAAAGHAALALGGGWFASQLDADRQTDGRKESRGRGALSNRNYFLLPVESTNGQAPILLPAWPRLQHSSWYSV